MISTKITAEAIREKLANTVAYVQDCLQRSASDQFVDMSGLDKLIENLCDQISSLPQEEGASLMKNMENLLASLNDLEKNIETKIGK